MSLYSFESASGVETIHKIGPRVGASEKAKGASEGFEAEGSIADRRSETQTEDIIRWEGLSLGHERLTEWEGGPWKR
jgi:hypothetical protein